MPRGNPFDAMYEGTPPWEIGHPQPAIVALAEAGKIKGRVLDLGCGTGENALFLAERGCTVIGVDFARKAIASALRKCRARGLAADFLIHDALAVSALDAQFDVILDSGFFHALTDEGRALYREELKSVMKLGSMLFILCFSEHEPDWGGPRRVTAEEIRETFAPPFFVESVEESRFETLHESRQAEAWLAQVTYVGMTKAGMS